MKTVKRREYAWNGQESIDEKVKEPSSVVKMTEDGSESHEYTCMFVKANRCHHRFQSALCRLHWPKPEACRAPETIWTTAQYGEFGGQ